MSTPGGESSRGHLTRIFKGRRERTRQAKGSPAFPAMTPHLRANRFRGVWAVNKKRELFLGLPPTSPSLLALPPTHVPAREYEPCSLSIDGACERPASERLYPIS